MDIVDIFIIEIDLKKWINCFLGWRNTEQPMWTDTPDFRPAYSYSCNFRNCCKSPPVRRIRSELAIIKTIIESLENKEKLLGQVDTTNKDQHLPKVLYVRSLCHKVFYFSSSTFCHKLKTTKTKFGNITEVKKSTF